MKKNIFLIIIMCFVTVSTMIYLYSFSASNKLAQDDERDDALTNIASLNTVKENQTTATNEWIIPFTEMVGLTDIRIPVSREAYEDKMMQIEIPKINLSTDVYNGTTANSLIQGPGLYEISPTPDIAGSNVCIAGHRTTYGAWFRQLDELETGDDIKLWFNHRLYEYNVTNTVIVEPEDLSILEEPKDGIQMVTLSACHPPGSAKQRIVVQAVLNEIIEEKDKS